MTHINNVVIDNNFVYSFTESNEINDATKKSKSQYFLEECTVECQELGLSQTFFLIDPNTKYLKGFFTLSTFYLESPKITGFRKDSKANPGENDYFSAIKIDQLATDEKINNKSELGQFMIKTLIDITMDNISPFTGCKFIVILVNRQEEQVNFFKESGFIELTDEMISSKQRKSRGRKDKTWMILILSKNS